MTEQTEQSDQTDQIEQQTRQSGRIVVGYDRSTHSRHALEWAAHEAARAGRPLTVLFVVDYGGLIVGGPAGLTHWYPDLALESGRSVAEEGAAAARSVAPGVDVVAQTQVGRPAALLVQASRSADLLVVGTRGHGELVNLAIGSVAASVAAHATCPVVIVRGPGDVLVGPDHRVVVGVDGSPSSHAALAFAAETADRASAPLTVLCAWNVLAGEDWADAGVRAAVALDEGTMRADELRAAQKALDEAVAEVHANHPHVDVTPVLAEAQPAVELVRLGANAGLIVVGTRGYGAVASLMLGSVSHAVVHAATRPVAVVRAEVPVEEGTATAAAAPPRRQPASS